MLNIFKCNHSCIFALALWLGAAACASLSDPSSGAPGTPADQEEAGNILLRSPLGAPRTSLLHAALDVPPIETARTLPSGASTVRVWTSRAHSETQNTFDATYCELLAGETRWAPFEGFEVASVLRFNTWHEHVDTLYLYDDTGQSVVYGESVGDAATSRHLNLSTVGLRSKIRIAAEEDAGLDLALAPSLRFPIAPRRDVTHAGTTDAGLALLGSLPVGSARIHANIGAVKPLGNPTLFDSRSDADIKPFVHGGAALVVPIAKATAFALQVEANSSAFEHVPVLDEPVFETVAGVRTQLGKIWFEVGLGTGFNRKATYDHMGYLAVTFPF